MSKNTHWNAKESLANHKRILDGAIERAGSHDTDYKKSLIRGSASAEKIISGRVGKIRPMNCLEGLLFNEYLKVHDLRLTPSEFMAYIFSKDSILTVVVDLDRPKVDSSIGLSPSEAFLGKVSELQSQGWRHSAHLHNHPFNFDNLYGDIGGNLAPSDADIRSYLLGNPFMATITNGIESIELRNDEFAKLK